MTISLDVDVETQQPPATAFGAVDKAMIILSTLAEESEPLSLAELSRRTSLPKTTVHRLLAVLRAHDMIHRAGDRYLRSGAAAGPRRAAVPGGSAVLALLRGESTPFLVELHNHTGATASVSVLADRTVRVVNQVFGHRGVRVASSSFVGRPSTPATASSTVFAAEKILLAYGPGDPDRRLTEVRRSGVAFSVAPDAGVSSVAVPVCDNGAAFQLPIALSVSGRTGGYDPVRAADHLRHSSYSFARTLRGLLARSG